jgi:predicted GIY-YIG superfamily endonuclease
MSKSDSALNITMPGPEHMEIMDSALGEILGACPLSFADMVPSAVPQKPGVYVITSVRNGVETVYYVGRTKNLRQRLYNNHLMGPFTNARLKKYLVQSHECADIGSAKQFLRDTCLARWLVRDEMRIRGAIEGYLTARLFPKYGIYEEH